MLLWLMSSLSMTSYILSLLSGMLAGAIYSLIRVRSPAPPMVALVGLLGMVIGAQIIPTGRQLLASTTLPFAKTEVVQARTPHSPPSNKDNLISRAPAKVSPS
jgi:XapX domain-containing protein